MGHFLIWRKSASYSLVFLPVPLTAHAFSQQENDYINSYFDNGDDFGADSDDNMDEATY